MLARPEVQGNIAIASLTSTPSANIYQRQLLLSITCMGMEHIRAINTPQIPRMITIRPWTLAIAVILAGCTAEFPLKWKPTEPQKQAADLAVKDIQALAPHVAPAAEPIRAEAQQAAEITQTYLGLPKTRPVPVAQANPQLLAQAREAATRPTPTIGQAGDAVISEGQRLTQTGFSLAELALTAFGSIAGIWGAGKFKGKIDGWRNTAQESQWKVNDTLEALRQVVQSIDALPSDTRAAVKKVQQQSAATESLVREARKQ